MKSLEKKVKKHLNYVDSGSNWKRAGEDSFDTSTGKIGFYVSREKDRIEDQSDLVVLEENELLFCCADCTGWHWNSLEVADEKEIEFIKSLS